MAEFHADTSGHTVERETPIVSEALVSLCRAEVHLWEQLELAKVCKAGKV